MNLLHSVQIYHPKSILTQRTPHWLICDDTHNLTEDQSISHTLFLGHMYLNQDCFTFPFLQQTQICHLTPYKMQYGYNSFPKGMGFPMMVDHIQCDLCPQLVPATFFPLQEIISFHLLSEINNQNETDKKDNIQLFIIILFSSIVFQFLYHFNSASIVIQ